MPRDTPGFMWGPCSRCPYSGRLKEGVCRVCRADDRAKRKRAVNAAYKKRMYWRRRERERKYGACAGVGSDMCRSGASTISLQVA